MIKNIKLNTINAIKEFVNETAKCQFDVDIISGRYVIDAKSIMGVLSLDLDKPISLHIRCNDVDSEDYLKAISNFIID
ncbi:MAG: HPr family phosphocarrier protein [Oscillospiraceae bacterium]|nr:HPr family phosphocarrier protein [Oscillospiraceae bacterium]